jgi:aryl-alcohol dehydrogenase-like predicted oxidoreductase
MDAARETFERRKNAFMIHQSQYHPLGTSGLAVSPLGVGTNRWKHGTNTVAAFQAFQASVDVGVTFFDQETLQAVAQHHGKSVSQVILNWLLRRDAHVIPIPGTTSARHAQENADTLSWILSDEEFAAIDEVSTPRNE